MHTWIHTCPHREPRLDPLLQSLHQSDLGEYEIRSCTAQGLRAVEDWMVAQLDELTQDHEWVLRLEDDIVVSPHIRHNVEHWPARQSPYFGIGLLFRFSWHVDQWDSWRVDAATGSLWADDRVSGAQAVLYRSEVWPRIRKHLPVLYGSLMDLGVTEAVRRANLRNYMHRPSLVQTSEVSKDSPLHLNQHEHYALDYDPDYVRPPDEQRDQPVLKWTKGKVTRYLPRCDRSIMPVLVDPWKRDIDFASNIGSVVVVDHSKLHDDPADAMAIALRPSP